MAQETQHFLSHGLVKRNILAYSMLWRPNGRGLRSTPLKWSKDQTWVPRFFLISRNPICEKFPHVEVSHALHKMITIQNQSKEESENTHKYTTQQQHAQKQRQERNNKTTE
jgi:hypothetical protein